MESYSRKRLVKAIEDNHIYDYIAEHYPEMSTYDLKEVLLSVLGVCYDHCGVGANRDEEEAALMEEIKCELVEYRDFVEYEEGED